MLPAAIFLATQAPIHEHLIKQLAGTIHAIRYKRAEVFRARNPESEYLTSRSRDMRIRTAREECKWFLQSIEILYHMNKARRCCRNLARVKWQKTSRCP